MNQGLTQLYKFVHPQLWRKFWLLSIVIIFWPTDKVAAQIIPDRTLPNNSMVNAEGTVIRIEGGSQAGSNLFHSFSDFSVPTGTEALFNNAATIENILTRVTGGNISNIDGLIRANGDANLFLLNPNGILFGPNATLNIGGSFFASSAQRLLFPDGWAFDTNVGTEHDSPLLSVNVPIGLQLAQHSGTILVNGSGISEIVPTDNLGLTVAPGQTLAFVGNEINVNGGIVTAPSGRIELGSVGSGEVGIVQTPVGFDLNYDKVDRFGNIELSNGSSLFSPAVVENPFNAIALTGRNIRLDGSQIVSLTNNHVSSGNITVRAIESLELGGAIANFPFSSWIVNQVATEATGNSGDIEVISPNISIDNGARIQTLSLGPGSAGTVTVNATDSIDIIGFGLPPDFNLDASAIDPETLLAQNTNSRIASENFASGAGGTVSVSTGELNLLGGGQIVTLSASPASANSGTINLTARSIHAENSVAFNPLVPSGISSYTLGEAEGGDIEIVTEDLTLIDGALIFSWAQGSGRGGNMTVNARDRIIARELNPAFPVVSSGIVSVDLGGGNSGDISLSTGELNVSEGAQITSLSFIEFIGISRVNASTQKMGDVSVNAETIELSGTSALAPDNATTIGSVTFSSADTGNVTISTKQLRVVDGAIVTTLAIPSISALGAPLPGSGTGNGGHLTVNASESIQVVGTNPFIPSSGSFVGTQNFGIGNAGEFILNVPQLTARNGAGLGSLSRGGGDAGRVTVNASEILLDGLSAVDKPASITADAFSADEAFQQAFFASAIPVGNTGEVTINADLITLTNGGQISVQHEGTGNAGRLQITSDRLNLDSGGNINASTASGLGGDVDINVPDLLQLRNGSEITVEALGSIGDGGNLTLNADTVVALENSDIVANSVGGNGGNITITTRGIFGTQFRPELTPESDITASSQFGVSGTVILNTPDIDASRGLVDLPENTTDLSQEVLVSCAAASSGSSFVVTGRGGLPTDPTVPFRGSVIWYDLQNFTMANREAEETVSVSNLDLNHRELTPLVEATSVAIAPDGTVRLVTEVASRKAIAVDDLSCDR